jgi:hypothetical protein
MMYGTARLVMSLRALPAEKVKLREKCPASTMNSGMWNM